jgi:hypothetical protein
MMVNRIYFIWKEMWMCPQCREMLGFN